MSIMGEGSMKSGKEDGVVHAALLEQMQLIQDLLHRMETDDMSSGIVREKIGEIESNLKQLRKSSSSKETMDTLIEMALFKYAAWQ